MFWSSVQPPILSLFSSTSTEPLSLFSTHTDPSLPSDSFIHVLDDESCLPEPPSPKDLIKLVHIQENEEPEGDALADPRGFSILAPVLHIQSPTLRHAYIRCPPLHWKANAAHRARDLGIKLGWMHMQVRNLGREWSFEVGVVDQAGREGRVRCSTFQKQPSVRAGSSGLPLLHIPFKFPPLASRPMTAWSTISFNLPTLIPHFSSLASHTSSTQVPLPNGQFSHISYVKVFATCRLRRIYFTAEKSTPEGEPWEFGLYGR